MFCSVSYTEQRWLDQSNTFLIPFLRLFLYLPLCVSIRMLRPSWCVRVRVKIAKCNFFFVCNGPSVPPAIYSEPRFHESLVMNSQQSILGKNSRLSTLKRWTRNVLSSKWWNILSLHFITSWPLYQIKQGNQTHCNLGIIYQRFSCNLGSISRSINILWHSSTG